MRRVRSRSLSAASRAAPGSAARSGASTIPRGREAIIASYAASSAWGRERLTLTYVSEVEPGVGREVPVLFTDDLGHGERTHRYRCRQKFTVGRDGLIERIVHEEIPGEREALEEFFRQCGIEDRG